MDGNSTDFSVKSFIITPANDFHNYCFKVPYKKYNNLSVAEHLDQNKFIVHGHQLLDILVFCQENGCNSKIGLNRLKFSTLGSKLQVHWRCANDHEFILTNDPSLCTDRKVACGSVLDGGPYSTISGVANFMKLHIHELALKATK